MARTIVRKTPTLLCDERGSAAILVAPMILVLVGAAAIGVDSLNAFMTHERLRTAAEAAAVAGVAALPDEEAARSAALLFGEKNLPAGVIATGISDEEIELGHWDADAKTFDPDPDTEPVNAVRVTASLVAEKSNSLPTWFGGVIGVPTMEVAASAIAVASDGTPCILALDPSASKALSLNSNADIDVENCEVHVRSTASDAFSADSNATVASARNCVAGNYSERSNSDIQPSPETGCDAADDPFAAVAPPPTTGTCISKTVDSKEATLMPGIYCKLEIKNNAKVTFSPGIYVIKNTKFLVDSNSSVTGDGVGFYLTGSGALLEFNSNVTVSFKAPQSGPMAGLIFFQDRSYGGEHKFDSNVAAVLEGAMYFPNATFKSNSNATMASDSSCFMLVAKRISFDSNAGVNMSGDHSKCPWLPGGIAGKHTRIVG